MIKMHNNFDKPVLIGITIVISLSISLGFIWIEVL